MVQPCVRADVLQRFGPSIGDDFKNFQQIAVRRFLLDLATQFFAKHFSGFIDAVLWASPGEVDHSSRSRLADHDLAGRLVEHSFRRYLLSTPFPHDKAAAACLGCRVASLPLRWRAYLAPGGKPTLKVASLPYARRQACLAKFSL